MKTVEQKYFPIIKLLEENSFLESIENEYKGFITALNPLIRKPKILFLGINPGSGAFDEKNKSKKIKQKYYPKTLFSNNKITKIDWLKDGNARGEFKAKIWKPYKWYERNEKVNNTFVKRLIEFLFTYYNIDDTSDYVEIENRINSDIFYSNLYPIATKTTKELNIILKKIVLKEITLNNKKIKSIKDLKNFFRQRTIDLIKELQPEIIICLGNQSFKDLTLTTPKIDSKNTLAKYEIQLRKNDIEKSTIYIVSRNGNWEHRIKKLGKHIKPSKPN